MRARPFLHFLLLATVFAAFPAAAQKAAPGQIPLAKVSVTTAEVRQESVPLQLATTGTVRAIASISIKPQIDGEIVTVHVTDGAEVKAGDLLFSIDDRQAKAALDMAAATVLRDQAVLDNANRQVERYRPLTSRNDVSKEQFDQYVTQAQADEATLQQSKAQSEQAKVTLGYTKITAPFDGKVGILNVKQGSIVKSGDSTLVLVTLNQMNPIQVSYALPQRYLPAVQEARQKGVLDVAASIDGDTRGPVHGKLEVIDNAVDPTTGTITVLATFPNEDMRLWPGLLVNLIMTLGHDDNVLTVPVTAVQMGQDGPYVFVVKDDSSVERRLVSVVRTNKETTILSSGVTAGETVVVDGQFRLAPGFKVTPHPIAPDAEAKP